MVSTLCSTDVLLSKLFEVQRVINIFMETVTLRCVALGVLKSEYTVYWERTHVGRASGYWERYKAQGFIKRSIVAIDLKYAQG